MTRDTSAEYEVRLATSPDELHAAYRLRYDVFVDELGGRGSALVDHAERLEKDHFDPFVDHLTLLDRQTGQCVGVYRLLRRCGAEKAGGFYSESEYDLSVLKNSPRRVLELGRSCLHPKVRGGRAMHHLWGGLASYVAQHDIEILFGVASFRGTDIDQLAEPLSLLKHRHSAPQNLRVRALEAAYQTMDLIPEADLDIRRATTQLPSLIKAYLRLGGCVGDGAYIDHAFNTTDVCLMMDTSRLSERQARIYGGGAR